jgi:hypothetical protein
MLKVTGIPILACSRIPKVVADSSRRSGCGSGRCSDYLVSGNLGSNLGGFGGFASGSFRNHSGSTTNLASGLLLKSCYTGFANCDFAESANRFIGLATKPGITPFLTANSSIIMKL